MKLDLIVATYNRELLLSRLLESVRGAAVPPDLRLRVIVADNNSSDGTASLVARLQSTWGDALRYVFEERQGKSFALNAALDLADGDVVGFVDDDEQVAPSWFETVLRVFEDPSVAFASGPYFPNWVSDVPAWLPPDYPAVVGWVDAGPATLEYGVNYSGTMMGGNAAIRTHIVKRLGGFNTDIGRIGSNLCGCEDADLSYRLTASGARGLYVPEMIIYHYVPPERVTKRYYRRWCLHHAVSLASVDDARPQAVAYFCRIPRYRIGRACRAVPALMSAAIRGRWNTPAAFSAELALWDLAGFVRGKFFQTPADLDRSTGARVRPVQAAEHSVASERG
ncbi:MAG TPA: glycosyltransferase [Vicinamibacterales bacterium]|nr:glycosyltransferase [Vicinamibacterales bacterium]